MDTPQHQSSEQAAPHDMTAAVCPAITLADLPSEIVVHILSFLRRPKYLMAARMASRVFGCVDVVERAAAWALHPKHARALIMSRAPCYMIAQALPLYVSHASSEINPESLLEVAARGGRVEVLCIVHQYITPRAVTCSIRRIDVYRAACIASTSRHIDVLRYILTRTFGGVKGKDCGWDLKCAAATGNADVFAFAHDMFAQSMTSTRPCRCDETIGRAAWSASRADAALWMRDFGCAGYCPPTVDHLCEAIIQGYDTLSDLVQHIEPIVDPHDIHKINTAAAWINPGTSRSIRVLLDCDLPIEPMALFVSAASVADIEAMALVTERFPPTMHMVRAAVLASVFDIEYSGASAAAWLVERWPDAVDTALVTACVLNGALCIVRLLEPLVRPLFDWQRAVGTVLASQDADMIAYAVEQKGVVLDEHVVLTTGFLPRAPAVAYLVQRCGLERTQAIYDMAATLCDRKSTFDTIEMPLTGRDDGLCLDAYRTIFWVRERFCEAGHIPTCGCARCSTPKGGRPAKRRRTEPSSTPSLPPPLPSPEEDMTTDH
ncbi:hypothetical protein pneo_cds_602 [Pandoravirus neocaledonia]|uniref:F-box domain-containing protein n=1 Tax=Pandoravirus neocaledonia TaxID=2107708 RepID=A0A2U7UCL5_9VIRU|nr:hypothetical protein pneo_cds_602 [Pandoravirus neocaledonia]AVK76209.1 hypothetical protein pneo_cds_602 [Pandoravirus neocaledonia]